MNSTKVQNPRRKMQVALLAEPKTPLESSVFIGERERANLVVQLARFFCISGVDVCRNVLRNSNSTKVQNPRRKKQVALLAEPKTPPGVEHVYIIL